MFKLAMIPLLALTLVACQEEEQEDDAAEETCGAAALQELVGTDIAERPDLDPDTDLRIIEPGMAVTMDYRADRLNIEVDEAGQVTKVYCG